MSMTQEWVPDAQRMAAILTNQRTIAVVGLSDDPSRPSHDVAGYLRRQGYTIIPVNPKLSELWGLKAYPDLKAAAADGHAIDVVEVFRRPETVMPVVDDAIAIGAKTIWFQEGVVNEEAARRARQAGLEVVMDRCMKKEHARFAR